MQLACSLKKPLFLHERDAHVEMVELLTRYREKLPACVIHCFTGTKEHALTYLNLGCYIGLTGIILFSRVFFLKNIVITPEGYFDFTSFFS